MVTHLGLHRTYSGAYTSLTKGQDCSHTQLARGQESQSQVALYSKLYVTKQLFTSTVFKNLKFTFRLCEDLHVFQEVGQRTNNLNHLKENDLKFYPLNIKFMVEVV